MKKWLVTTALVSVACATGLAASDVAAAITVSDPAASLPYPASTRAWAQDAAEPQVEQMGEDTSDVETLDEGAPVASGTADDIETLDAGSPPAVNGDIELLDESSPPTQVTTSDTAAPMVDAAPTFAAPASSAQTGFILPPGFGSGRVQVSTGAGGFPEGLEPCHVGAVTGRAYVGIDCGEGDSFVGHAPSFADFPFVVEADFPFGEANSPFADVDFPFGDADFPFGDDNELAVASDVSDDDGNGVTVVSAQQTEPPVVTADGSTAQQQLVARERNPRVRLQERGSGGADEPHKKRKQRARGDDNDGDKNSKQRAGAKQRVQDDDRARTESGKKARDKGKKRGNDNGKKNKDKKRQSARRR